MTDKQKQIEEMAHIIAPCEDIKCSDCVYCNFYKYAEQIYNAGYRKQSDTAREVIIKVLSIIQNEYEYYPDGITLGAYAQLRKEINELAAEYNVEV